MVAIAGFVREEVCVIELGVFVAEKGRKHPQQGDPLTTKLHVKTKHNMSYSPNTVKGGIYIYIYMYTCNQGII